MSSRTAYDEVRYSNYPYAQTHPDRLATIAAMHGVPAPDPRTARVLFEAGRDSSLKTALKIRRPARPRGADDPALEGVS